MANTTIPLELSAYAPTASGATLELQTTDTTVTDGSVLGKIEFKAPSEASGTDAILVGAAIEAVAEGTFAADNNATELLFKTGASEAAATKMVLTSAGNVGIGIASPSTPLHIKGASDAYVTIEAGAADGNVGFLFDNSSSTQKGALLYDTDDNYLLFNVNTSERMRIASNGFVGIGTTSPASISGAAGPVLDMAGNNPEIVFHDTAGTANAMSMYYLNDNLYWFNGSAQNMSLSNSGNLTVAGALSKGSGSFRIPHPLPEKEDTHDLVHSFVESPQANNIYRGEIDLVDGSASINIDEFSGMTEGTLTALNTTLQCFTTNETDWDAVKGNITGNKLTITCQNPTSTATISWIVIGERHDQNIKDSDWTDTNGKPILEPLKKENNNGN